MSSFEYTEKYYSRFIKKSEAKPAPVRLIMERTFHTAVWVLETIEGVGTNELNSATNLFISNLKNREFATIYGTQLEIAWTNVINLIPHYLTYKIRDRLFLMFLLNFSGQIVIK